MRSNFLLSAAIPYLVKLDLKAEWYVYHDHNDDHEDNIILLRAMETVLYDYLWPDTHMYSAAVVVRWSASCIFIKPCKIFYL